MAKELMFQVHASLYALIIGKGLIKAWYITIHSVTCKHVLFQVHQTNMKYLLVCLLVASASAWPSFLNDHHTGKILYYINIFI